MAELRIDYKLVEAHNLILRLKELDDRSVEQDLLIYYVNEREKHIKELSARLREYQEFFRQLDRFLPNHNPIIR